MHAPQCGRTDNRKPHHGRARDDVSGHVKRMERTYLNRPEGQTTMIYTGTKLNTTQTILLYGADGRAVFTSTASTPSEPVSRETKSPSRRAPKACACGCGGSTKGGTWLPGHDAKHASRMLKESGTHSKAPKSCLCGCGGMTAGGHFKPGHDAKFYSKLRRESGLQIGEV